MSPVDASPTSEASPGELWAGKSRNAKAQARHRAKRKAYIEQLEQTVAKLQTALALSAEDAANLPTPQTKLRELKEENDSLRAEIRKLQVQQPIASASYTVPPLQVHSPASSDDYPRHSKRRKTSPTRAEDFTPRNTYLGPVDSMVDVMSGPHVSYADSRSVPTSAPPSMPPPRVGYHLQHPDSMTPQRSPVDAPVVQHPREATFTWTSYSHQANSVHPPAPSAWTFPSHHRQRSSSGSSSSSDSSPTYLTQPQTPMQMSLAPSYKSTLSNDQSVSYDPASKALDRYHYDQASEASTAYTLPSGLPMSACEPAHVVTAGASQNSAWPDVPSWSYSSVRMQ